MILAFHTAFRNVVGDPIVDHKEGVGTVNAYAAYNCVKNGWTWKEYKRLNWYGGPSLPYC